MYAEAQVADGQEPEQAVFELIGSLIDEQVLPPTTAAVFYRAVTRIPGVEVERDATDALGRPGVGISRTDPAFRTRSEWIFDEDTHELLGTRNYFTQPDGGPDTLRSHRDPRARRRRRGGCHPRLRRLTTGQAVPVRCRSEV